MTDDQRVPVPAQPVAIAVVERRLVREFGGPRPPITVLCGSTRFFDAFRRANLELTLAGHIVLSIGCDTKTDGELFGSDDDPRETKAALDELHLRKIDLADEVLVLDVGGYIGVSTRGEINYATELGKPIRYLSQRLTGIGRLCNYTWCFTNLDRDDPWCPACGHQFCPRHIYVTFVDRDQVRRHTPRPMCSDCLSPWREQVLAAGNVERKFDPVGEERTT